MSGSPGTIKQTTWGSPVRAVRDQDISANERYRKMRAICDAVVIGSGFGGSVAACRLAQAGCSVTVLERGRRYDNHPFPRNWNDPTDGWLWQVRQGLFELKHFSQMMVVQGAGLGGGSLIYANVHLRAPQEVFRQGWPAEYNRMMLDPYYAQT
jgi:cholesterol oxidase